MSGVSFTCRFDCSGTRGAAALERSTIVQPAVSRESSCMSSAAPGPLQGLENDESERGVVAYLAPSHLPLDGPPLRSGQVWRYAPEAENTFGLVELSLYATGFAVSPVQGDQAEQASVAWSPFSLVQACRFHSPRTDAAYPCLKLFKISVFGRGAAYFFATEGEDADQERVRWVADVARTIRLLTASLFPRFVIRTTPPKGAPWSAKRLMAGYLLLCADESVLLLYCELHTHWDDRVAFAAYENENCDAQVMRLSIAIDTWVTERVGVDCACFSIDGHQFASRTRAERDLWLRAISNLRVKMKHKAANPSSEEIGHYRAAVSEYASRLPPPPEDASARGPLLPEWKRPAAKSISGPDRSRESMFSEPQRPMGPVPDSPASPAAPAAPHGPAFLEPGGPQSPPSLGRPSATTVTPVEPGGDDDAADKPRLCKPAGRRPAPKLGLPEDLWMELPPEDVPSPAVAGSMLSDTGGTGPHQDKQRLG